MKKRLFSLLTSLIMVISLVAVMPTMSVGALTSGDYEYSVLSDGTVKIMDYNGSAKNLVIPSTIDGKKVTSIGYESFYCERLTSVTIPDGVTNIGDRAFYWCESLTSVTIPDSVTSIGEDAFSNCDRLTSVTIGNGVTSIGEYAFAWCKSLTSITIPDSVTSIGDHAFYSCDSLKSVTIGNSVTSIGGSAFYYCDSLTSITIPDSVTSIGDYAFYYCYDLKNVNYTGTIEEWNNISIDLNKSCLTEANIHYNYDSTKDYYIGSITEEPTCTTPGVKTYTCLCGYSYTEEIPSTAHKYENNTCTVCGAIEGLKFTVNSSDEIVITGYDGSLTKFAIPSTIGGKKVTSIGDFAFFEIYTISPITEITIPDSVTQIGDYAFSSCDSLTSINVNTNNKYYSSVDGVLFNKNKTELIQYPIGNKRDSYTIPDSVTSIRLYAFDESLNLSNIVIPDSVTSIGSGAFWDCKNLTNVTIPNSVTSIESSAFGYYTTPNGDWASIPNFKIYCYSGTAGEQYAIDNDIPYELLDSVSVTKPTTFKMALNSSSSVRLSWNKVSGANGYILEQYKSGKWIRVAKITSPSTVQYSVKGLASGTTYKFRMKAYKMSGGKAYYSGYTSTLTTCTNPATPKAKMALNSSSSIRLSWNKITGAGGYIVEQYKGGKWVRLTKITSPSTIQYSVKGLASGTTYKFRVKAYKMLGSKAYYSSYSSTVTTCTKPATVKFTLTAGTNKATVKWNKVTGASGYIVYYKTSANGSWTRLKKVGSSTTSYTKTGLTKGKTYYFTVKPYKTLGGKVYYGGITSKSVKVK